MCHSVIFVKLRENMKVNRKNKIKKPTPKTVDGGAICPSLYSIELNHTNLQM